jgi:hypothetical protein
MALVRLRSRRFSDCEGQLDAVQFTGCRKMLWFRCSLLVHLSNLQIFHIRLPLLLLSQQFPSSPHPQTYIKHLFPLNLIRGLLNVFPVYQSVHRPLVCNTIFASNSTCVCVHVCAYLGRCKMPSTYFTKLSSAGLFALMGGEVGASAFLPPVARTAPPMVTVRVAIASCNYPIISKYDST